MGKLIHVPYHYAPADFQPYAKNWRQTSGGSNVRQGCSAAVVKALANLVNRCAGRYPRPWFWMAQPITSDTTVQADTAGSDPLYMTKMYDGVPNARDFTCRVVGLPRTSGAGNCYAGRYVESEATPYNNATPAALAPTEDAFQAQFEVNRGAATDSEVTTGISTFNGYTLLDCVFQDDPLKTFDSAVHDCVDPDLATSGQPVAEGIAEQIRSVMHNARSENLPVVIQWHAAGSAGSWATPAGTTFNAIVVDQTGWTNLQDTGETIASSPHSRSATGSPGVLIPAQYTGRGTQDKTAGKSVKMTVRVLAQAVGDDGDVQFEGPDHVASNTCSLSWTAGAGVSWQGSDSDFIYLNTEAGDDDVSTERNKVDMFGKVDSVAGTLYIYAIVAWIIWG